MLFIIQNDPDVPPGSYACRLAERGIHFRTVRLDRGEVLPPLEGADGVIVLGGTMCMHDTGEFPFLLPLREFIRGCLSREIPYLGICLGGQLLADAAGGAITRSSGRGERGIVPVTLTPAGESDPLFRGIARIFKTFEWHDDSFEHPKGSVLLASSAVCQEQAFRLGARAWGLQFHPEVVAGIVEDWSRDENRAERERLLGEFLAAEGEYRASALAILDNFFLAAGLA